VRTAFAATAPFSDVPCRLLSWANTALIERAGTSSEFVTAACVTYLPSRRLLRWAYAGHPPALARRRPRAPRRHAGDAHGGSRGHRVRGGLAADPGRGGRGTLTDDLCLLAARHLTGSATGDGRRLRAKGRERLPTGNALATLSVSGRLIDLQRIA
jgi:hypothetical protein